MELVFEQEEVDALIREALAARGLQVPKDLEMFVRQNHKKGTLRVVFKMRSPNG